MLTIEIQDVEYLRAGPRPGGQERRRQEDTVRTYCGNSVGRRDEGNVCDPVRKEHLPESTSTTRDSEPEATDGRSEDDEVEAHGYPVMSGP